MTTCVQIHAKEIGPSAEQFSLFERLIAHYLKDVIAELCLIDVGIIRFYADRSLHGNIDDLISSSTELYLRDRVLSYGFAADHYVELAGAPAVSLALEFRDNRFNVLFGLILSDSAAAIAVRRIDVASVDRDDPLSGVAFETSLQEARLIRLPTLPYA